MTEYEQQLAGQRLRERRAKQHSKTAAAQAYAALNGKSIDALADELEKQITLEQEQRDYIYSWRTKRDKIAVAVAANLLLFALLVGIAQFELLAFYVIASIPFMMVFHLGYSLWKFATPQERKVIYMAVAAFAVAMLAIIAHAFGVLWLASIFAGSLVLAAMLVVWLLVWRNVQD